MYLILVFFNEYAIMIFAEKFFVAIIFEHFSLGMNSWYLMLRMKYR